VKKSALVISTSTQNPPGSAQDSSSSSPPPSLAAASSVAFHRYNSKDQPPFVVQVQSTQKTALSHPLHISRVISQIFPRDILEIKKVGRNKVLVQTNSYEAANRLVSNSSLFSHNLKAFIPTYKVLRARIVKDVPQDLSVELLRESISSSIKILEIHRLNRRIKIDNEIRYVPSRTVCLKFAGQSLLGFIYLFNCRYPVQPFIPKTRICFSCFRVGHLSKVCKSRPRCLHCGEASHDTPEICAFKQSSPKCINCNGEHLATSHDCPKVLTLSLAATRNIPFAEALRSVCSSFPSSPTSITDPRLDFHNFPPLPRHPSSGSPPNFFSPNSFSALSNLSPSNESSVPPPPKSFSSSLRNPRPSHRAPLSKQHSPLSSSSSPSSSNNLHRNCQPASAFPQEHRDLLLHPHGRPVPIPAEHTQAFNSSFSPSLNHIAHPVFSEFQPNEIHRLSPNPAEIIQQLLILLRCLSPLLDSNPNVNPSFFPMISRPPFSPYDSHSSSSWAQDSFSQP